MRNKKYFSNSRLGSTPSKLAVCMGGAVKLKAFHTSYLGSISNRLAICMEISVKNISGTASRCARYRGGLV